MCSPDQGHPRKPSEPGIPTSNYPRCISESLKYRQTHIFQDFVMVPKTNKIANLLFDTTGLPQLWGFMAVFHKPCCNSTLDLCLRIQFLWVNLMMAKCNRATGHWSTIMKKENHKKSKQYLYYFGLSQSPHDIPKCFSLVFITTDLALMMIIPMNKMTSGTIIGLCS